MVNNSSNGNSFNVKPRYSDEIDLMEVSFKTILLLRKYKTLLLWSLALALTIGVGLKLLIPPKYSSTIVINTPNLGKEEVVQIINSIDLQLEDPSFSMHGILEKLEVSNPERNANEPADNTFVINATVSDLDELSNVRNFIVSSIENNSYVKHLKAVETAKLQQTLKGIEEEEKRVADVLNHTIANNLPNENFSVADLAALKIDLMKEKAAIKATLDNVRSVSVVKDFQNVPQPFNKKLLVLFGIPMLLSLLVVAGYIIVQEVGRKFKEYEADAVRTPEVTIHPSKPLIKRTSYRPRVRQS